MRKRMLIIAVVISMAALAQPVNRGLTNFAPIPKAEPLTETVFGIKVDDPYRWMEKETRRADLEAWVNASSLHTTTELAALPGREPLFKAMQAASRANDAVQSARTAGGKVFFTQLASDRNVPVLMVREGSHDRMLLDPMALGDGKTLHAIGSFAPSPDGSRIAVQLAEGGSEIGKIMFLDVATGKPVGEELSPVWSENVPCWLGNSAVLYMRMRDPKPGADTMLGMRTMLHGLGTPAEEDHALLGGGLPSAGFKVPDTAFPVLASHPKSPWVIASAENARVEYPLAVARLADLQVGKLAYAQLADYDDRVNAAQLMGDTLYYQTSKTDQNGEVRALDLKPSKLSLENSR